MIQWTNDLSSSIYKDALAIRLKVFVEEQKIDPNEETDDLENVCTHFVYYSDDSKPIATARIYEKEIGQYKIQRVATLKGYRKKGYGRLLLESIEAFAKQEGYTSLTLGAQNKAIPFYEKLGYQINGPEYTDQNILHHDMIKNL